MDADRERAVRGADHYCNRCNVLVAHGDSAIDTVGVSLRVSRALVLWVLPSRHSSHALLLRAQETFFTLRHFSNTHNYPTIMPDTFGRQLKCGGLCEQSIGFFNAATNEYGIYSECVTSQSRQLVRGFDGTTLVLGSNTDDVSVHVQEVLNVLTKLGVVFVRRSGACAAERVRVVYCIQFDQLVPDLPAGMSTTAPVHLADFYDPKLSADRTTLVLPLDQLICRLNVMLKRVSSNPLGRVRSEDVEFYKKKGPMLQWMKQQQSVESTGDSGMTFVSADEN